MGKIISITNQKGGVGKTTTAVNLAAALQMKNLKTLLCDFDPQSNASSGMGVLRDDTRAGIYDVLCGKVAARNAVVRTRYVDVLPASISLAAAELELAELERREYRLKDALTPISFEYDYLIIDCPPSLSLLTINALTASDSVLVPLQCEYYALEGLSALMETIRALRKSLNPHLDIEGILLTMYDSRTNLSLQVAQEVKRYFPHQVFPVVIPRNVRISEAPSHGMPVTAYDHSSKGAKCYEKLAEYVISGRW